MKLSEMIKFQKNCRCAAAIRTDNIYEQTRMRIVRVMREFEGNLYYAAERLGCSEDTIRRYMNFVPFEHLMKNPELADRFDWRTMNNRRWVKLLRKHPQFINRMKVRQKKFLYSPYITDILKVRPELAEHFDLSLLEYISLAELLIHRPEFAEKCDLSTVTDYAAKELLLERPEFFERLDVSTLLPHHWEELAAKQPI